MPNEIRVKVAAGEADTKGIDEVAAASRRTEAAVKRASTGVEAARLREEKATRALTAVQAKHERGSLEEREALLKVEKAHDDVTAASEKLSEAQRKAARANEAAAKSMQDVGEEADKAHGKVGKQTRVWAGASKGIGAFGRVGVGAMGAVGAAIAGVGLSLAGLSASITSALDKVGSETKNQVRLALSPADAKKYGKAAADVYGQGFGESMDQVYQAIRGLKYEIGNFSEESVRNALTVANTFEQDLNGTIRAAGQLVKTGLSENFDSAMDVITAGLQHGVDKSDDFLDTLNEYGTQFRKMGISGAEATGLLSQGLQAGARDADKVADAIKEFAIRAVDGSKQTAEGFKELGLNAKQMADDVGEGGFRASKALEATLDFLRGIEDPVKRAQIAVKLFGTQAEDLGDALYALDPSKAAAELGELADSADRASEAMGDTPRQRIERLKRTISNVIADKTLAAMTAFYKLWDTQIYPAIVRTKEALQPLIDKAMVKLHEAMENLRNSGVQWDLVLEGLSKTLKVTAGIIGVVLVNALVAFSYQIEIATRLATPLWEAFRKATGLIVGYMAIILKAMRLTFGELPIIGDKIKKAEKDFAHFRDSVNHSLAGIKDRRIVADVEPRVNGAKVHILEFSNGAVKIKAGGRTQTAYAKGGPVTGPGGPTDDNVPALLSAGEYVIPADKVQKYGRDTFDRIRTGTAEVAGDAGQKVLRLASGGAVARTKAWLPSVDPKPYIWGGVGPHGYDCIAAGVLITTVRGDVPIEQVTTDDRVLTRDGWRRVLRAWKVRDDAETVTVHVNGESLIGTPDHRVWTENRGWVPLGELTTFDTVVSCQRQSSGYSPGSLTTSTPTQAMPHTGTTSSVEGSSCTASSGSRSTDRSPMVTRSTTSTTTPSTTNPTISTASPSPDTEPSRPHPGDSTISSARRAEPPSRPSETGMPFDDSAPSNTSGNSTTTHGQRHDVYDLTIEGEHEFFAAGVLVHNCSGLVGEVWNRLTGHSSYRRRFTTHTLLANPAAFGFERGKGTFTVGVSRSHTDGNLAGLGFEAASSRSGIHVGRGAKPVTSFPNVFRLTSLSGKYTPGGDIGWSAADVIKAINEGFSAAFKPLAADVRGALAAIGMAAPSARIPLPRASGGPTSGWTAINENGRELVRLPSGSTVMSNPDTEQVLAGAQGCRQQEVRVTLDVTGADREFVQFFRKVIRTKGAQALGVAPA